MPTIRLFCRTTSRRTRRGAEGEFRLAVHLAMIEMALAHGYAAEERAEIIPQAFEQLTGHVLSVEEVEAELRQARADEEEIYHSLAQIAASLADGGKEIVIHGAYIVAAADGEVDDRRTNRFSLGSAKLLR